LACAVPARGAPFALIFQRLHRTTASSATPRTAHR
jgi:hypothetical protein